MAFRILTSDEIELLTEQQRECYEEELALYQERVRFVEQLERQERMTLQPYEPKLKPIPATKKAPQQDYTAPEYTVASCDVPITAAPEAVSVSAQKVQAVIPTAAQVPPVAVEHIQVPEADSAVLPSVTKIAAPKTTLGKMTPAASVSVQQEALTVPVLQTGNLPEAKCQLPEKSVADIPRVGAAPTVSIDTQAVCNTAKAVPHPGKCGFTAPEQVCAKVPQVSVKAGQVKTVCVPAETKATLPEMPLTGQPVSPFAAPQLHTPAIPQTAMPEAPVRNITLPQSVNPRLPVASDLQMPANTFTPTTPVQVSLTVSAPMAVPSKTYAAPKSHPEIPSLQANVNLPKVTSAPPQPSVVSIEQPSVGKAPNVAFQSSIPQCSQPEVPSVQVPKVTSAPLQPSVNSIEQPSVGKAPNVAFQSSIPQCSQPEVPSVQVPKVTSAPLQPSVNSIEQPSVGKAPNVAFQSSIPQCSQPEVPSVQVPKVTSAPLQPSVNSIEQPSVGKAPNVAFQSSIPQCSQPEVPSVQVPKVTSAPLQPSVNSIEQPSVGKAPNVAFKGINCSTPKHPQISTVCAPDVLSDEIVRSLLHSDH